MYRKNVSGQHVPFGLVNASTGAALTGATVTAYRCIDGGSQAAATGAVTEKANGQYDFAPSQADMNGNQVGFLFTATDAIPVHVTISTTAGDPTDSVRFGLTSLPNAAANANGGLPVLSSSGTTLAYTVTTVTTTATTTNLTNAPTSGDFTATMKTSLNAATPASVTGAVGSVTGNVGGNVTGTVASVIGAVGSVTADVTANVVQWSGADVATPNVDGVPLVDLGYSLGQAVTNDDGTAQAGGASSITLASGSSSVNDTYNGRTITLVGGTGSGQSATVTDYVGSTKVATVSPAWVTQPDNTTKYVLGDAAPDSPGTTTLLGRVTGTVALASDLATVAGYLDTEIASILQDTGTDIPATLATLQGYIDTEVAAIKAKTDLIPASPAATGDIPSAATIAAAVRDVNNSTPAANSLGAAVNASASGGLDPQDVADLVVAGMGTVDANVVSMAANTVTASALAADAVTEIQSGLATAAALTTVDDFLDTEIAAIKAKTDLLPSSPAAVGSAMTLADGAITDAKITFPAEAAGQPTTALATLRRIGERLGNKVTRDRDTGAYNLRNAADSGNLETKTQSTAGTVDTQTKAV